MKSLETITLYDLMAENLDIWLTKNKKFGYDLEVDDEDYEPLIREDGVHPYAIDSFADFCRSFLKNYDSIANGEA